MAIDLGGRAVVIAANGALNVAAASQGATAIASSVYAPGYSATGAINGDRRGAAWGNGGGWNDGTPGTFPDWIEVRFAGSKTINEIDVFSVQDRYDAPSEPTPAMTFSLYGASDFNVQFWTGGTWQDVPGGAIAGNTLVWRKLSFAPITTNRIRVVVTRTPDGYWSRLAEIEAYTSSGAAINTPPAVSLTSPGEGASAVAPASFPIAATAADSDGAVSRVAFYANGALLTEDTTSPYSYTWSGVSAGSYTLTAVATDNSGATTTSAPVHVTVTSSAGRTNVALASNGSVASASSTFAAGFAAAGVINGDRRGLNWGAGGGWADANPGVYPDWLQIDFAGAKTIDEVDVFTVQDAWPDPSEPTPSQTFALYGLVDFTVQYWDGVAWQAVPNGVVRGNTLVWRTFTFAPLTTSRIRVLAERGQDGHSRLVEVEAFTAAGGVANAAPFVSLTSPANGAGFVAPASIPLAATASDPDGSVQKVEFYSGTTLLATVANPPYSYTWTGVAPGSYSVGAMAYDNLGAKTISGWRDITVTTGTIPSKAVFIPAIVPDYVRTYVLEFFVSGANPAVAAPVATQDLGLPPVVNGECAADVRNTILALAPGNYVATVTAITSEGLKLRSNTFAFTR